MSNPATPVPDQDFDEIEAQERIDEFAARALQGILSCPGGDDRAHGNPSVAAAWAYDFAEAMEAERAKRLAPSAMTPAEEAWEKSTRRGEDERQEGR